MNTNEIHILSRKQKSQFKLKAQIGPFVVNTRVTKKELQILLKEIKFKSSFSWPYDPLRVISKIRSEQNSTPYVHITKPEIEQFVNREEWEENTVQETEENTSSQTTLDTLRLKVYELKGPRQTVPPTSSTPKPIGFKVFKGIKLMNIEE